MPYSPPPPQSAAGELSDAEQRLAPEIQQATAALATVPSEVRDAFSAAQRAETKQDADARFTVGEAMLQAAALPSLDEATAAIDRQEVQLLFEAAAAGRDPERAFATALRIVSGPDRDLAAVVLSRWGQSFMRSKGLPDDPRVVGGLRAAAIRGAIEHGTPEQAKAAKALQQVAAPLRKAAALRFAHKNLLAT